MDELDPAAFIEQANADDLEADELEAESHIPSEREILLETLKLARDTNAKITEAVELIQSVAGEVGPVITSITESPAMKMLGFGPKKFGK